VAAGPCGVPVPGQAARADQAAHLEALADLTAAIGREATLARLGAAFSRLPPGTRRRCARPLTGSSLTDTFVFVETDDISQQHLEGVVVDGERDEDGEWVLDGEFTVFTTDEELIRVGSPAQSRSNDTAAAPRGEALGPAPGKGWPESGRDGTMTR